MVTAGWVLLALDAAAAVVLVLRWRREDREAATRRAAELAEFRAALRRGWHFPDPF